MMPLRLKVVKYFEDINYCEAVLFDGEIVAFDPFVGCAIPQSDEEYENGSGNNLVGETFLINQYYVQEWARDGGADYMITPSQFGMIREQ